MTINAGKRTLSISKVNIILSEYRFILNIKSTSNLYITEAFKIHDLFHHYFFSIIARFVNFGIEHSIANIKKVLFMNAYIFVKTTGALRFFYSFKH